MESATKHQISRPRVGRKELSASVGYGAPVKGGAMSEHAFPFAKSDESHRLSAPCASGRQGGSASVGYGAPVKGGAMSEHAFPFAKSDESHRLPAPCASGENRTACLTT